MPISTSTSTAASGWTTAPMARSTAAAHGRRKLEVFRVGGRLGNVHRHYASLFAYFSSAAHALGPNSAFQRS